MALRIVDISNWQKGIGVSSLDCDGIVAKATEGTGYVSPDCDRQVQQARKRGIPFGVYHYVTGAGAEAEAAWFADNIEGYIGEGLLAVDWEEGGNSRWGDAAYLRELAAEVIRITGVKPLIYVQKSALAAVASVAKGLDCGLWVAQYADTKRTGWQDEPWNEGAYSCAMRQYTSTGRVSGYSGDLDLNKFYGDEAAWRKYATAGKAGEPEPAPEPTPEPEPNPGQGDGKVTYKVEATVTVEKQ